MNKTRLLLGTAVAALLAVGNAQAGTLYIANLSPNNENPPVTNTFSGTGFLILNDAETTATITATHNINIAMTGGHIHRGVATANGPIIFPFTSLTSPVGPLVWAIPTAELTNLKNLGLYMNFHTTVNPGGAIRGQVTRVLLASSATGDPQSAVARALDVSAGLSTDLDQILFTQAAASGATRAAALDDLSGRTLHSQGRQAVETMMGFQQSLFSHGQATAEASEEGFGGYAMIGSTFGKRDAFAEQVGSKTSRIAMQAGFDYGLADGLSAGLGVGYADGKDKFKNSVGKTDARTISVLTHIAATSDGVSFAAVAGYGWNKFDTSRTLSSLSRTATASHDGKTWSLGAKVAVDLDLGNDVTVSPYGVFDTQHSKIDGYTEAGANAAGLIVPNQKVNDTGVEAGAALTVPLGADDTTVGRLQLGWRYLLNGGRDNVALRLVGSTVGFNGSVFSASNNTAHIGGSLESKFTDTLSGSIGYQGNISGRASNHAIEARLTLRM